MVYELISKLPLHRCECGGKVSLHPYVTIYNPHNTTRKGYFVSCDRFACNRMVTKIYNNPLVAVIKWNIKDWKYSEENNKNLKGE